MECMENLWQFNVTYATDYSQLVKMISKPEELSVFAMYFEDIKILRSSFNHAWLIHVPRTKTIREDSLAHSARKQPFFIVHIDAELPVWFTDSS
ncbi:hypothetical protein F2Q70_00018836 [Brassica cretica]|uniref:RNase H type-1 domain-containing protein n=1 Tax=Brassica cretica TaxID=69181 RepID=A0A8S9HTF2_BRACR|nr:hypothetical protein F2Q70_00018836 [Brassica cretica]KAF2600193.1 hypothetical protein F2Q68_00012460 [Brassica cretica]